MRVFRHHLQAVRQSGGRDQTVKDRDGASDAVHIAAPLASLSGSKRKDLIILNDFLKGLLQLAAALAGRQRFDTLNDLGNSDR